MLTYKRFHNEKRKWNSYPNKNFKTYKVYEIILNIKVGESMIKKTSLKLFTFRALKISFDRFQSQLISNMPFYSKF